MNILEFREMDDAQSSCQKAFVIWALFFRGFGFRGQSGPHISLGSNLVSSSQDLSKFLHFRAFFPTDLFCPEIF